MKLLSNLGLFPKGDAFLLLFFELSFKLGYIFEEFKNFYANSMYVKFILLDTYS